MSSGVASLPRCDGRTPILQSRVGRRAKQHAEDEVVRVVTLQRTMHQAGDRRLTPAGPVGPVNRLFVRDEGVGETE